MTLPTSIKAAVEVLGNLPSIGPRQATRLAIHLILSGRQEIAAIARAIALLGNIKICERCFFIHENEGPLCPICADPKRDQSTILIIEKETDLISLENTKHYMGRYLIIGPLGKLGTLEEWQKLRVKSLIGFVEKELNGKAKEIILGFNPTSHGDFSANYVAKEIAPYAAKLSRLGRGLPTGGEIEFADDETLGSALTRRS